MPRTPEYFGDRLSNFQIALAVLSGRGRFSTGASVVFDWIFGNWRAIS